MSRRDPILRLLTISLLILSISGWVVFFSGDKSPITSGGKTFAQGKQGGQGLEISGSVMKGCTAEKIPVLMYHHIRHCPPGSVCGAKGSVEYGLSVEPELFDWQMATLKDKGYHSILPRELTDGKVPCKSFILTFDDGYDDNLAVLPILHEYGFHAGFAIIIDRVDTGGYMGGSDIVKLKDAGHEILSHSVSHPNLTLLSDQDLQYELRRSKAALQSAFKTPVHGMVYPSGKYNERIERAARRAGYRMAFTTIGGWAAMGDNPYTLRRVRMSNTTNADLSEVLR